MSVQNVVWGTVCLLMALGRIEAGEPVVVAAGSGSGGPKQPQVCVSEDGGVDVVYVRDGQIHLASSVAGDLKFADASAVIPCRNLSAGMRRGPRLARTGETVVVSAIDGAMGKGRDGDVLAWRTSDSGQSWHGPVRVNDVADAAREGLHAMTVTDSGRIICVWLDLRNKRSEVMCATSDDAGATWSPNRLVYQSPDGNVCECCHPTVVASGGRVHVMFRNSLGGNRDMYVVESTDDGTTFSKAKKLGVDSWQLDACPMDGGMLAVNGSGRVTSLWRRDHTVFVTDDSKSPEIALGRGEQPWVASSGDAWLAVWTAKRNGELMVRLNTDREPEVLDTQAAFPVVVAGHAPGEFLVAWEHQADGHSDVRVQSVGPRSTSRQR